MLTRLLRVGARGWLDLIEAQLWVVWAQLLVWFFPKGRLVVRSAGSGDGEPLRAPGARARADRVTLAVSRACRFGPLRAECLVRSIALQRMLTRVGIADARVLFGVRTRDGVFESHAWVECGGRLVGDEPAHVSTFAPLEGFSVSDRRIGS